MKKSIPVVLILSLLAALAFLVLPKRSATPGRSPDGAVADVASASGPGSSSRADVEPASASADPDPSAAGLPAKPAATGSASRDSAAAAIPGAGSDARDHANTADDFAARFASAATPADLLQAADLTNPAERAYVVARMAEMQEQQREAALARAERLGIPLRIEGPGRKVSVLYDFRDDRPLYRVTLNANAAISTGANLLRVSTAPYALDGSGMRVGVWDEAKVRNTHQEFSGGRVAIKDNASGFSDHATHVAGTIGATGVAASARGMAPLVGIDSYDWNDNYSEMTAAGAATATDSAKISLSNHSYGYDAVTADMGRYETEARTLDALVVAQPFHSIFQAAGNEQDLLTALGGYQSITFAGLAKNIITVAAGDDAVSGGTRAPSAGTLAEFSSLGPCDDGRIKPDLTANGVDLYSPVATSNTAYDGTYSGTSMATPNALGSALLVQQLYAREFSGAYLRASMLKALFIQTADDVGRPGPDYQYGWGYLNAKAAADLVLAHKASLASPKLIEGTLTNAAKTQTHVFTWDGVSPIRATLCWTDPAGAAQTAADSRTANLVHDLDLRLTAPDGSTVTLPFVMPFVGTWTLASMSQNAVTGANHVDNVEQVRVAAPSQPGNYTLTVSLTGSLTTASQIYSLVVTGGTDVEANPPPVVTLDTPADGTVLLSGEAVALSATATDKIIGGGAGVVAEVAFYHGTTLIGTDATAPYSLSWTPPAAGAYSLTAAATDTEGSIGRSAAVQLVVLSGDGAPTLSGFSPASGVAGDSITLTGSNFAAVSSVSFNGVAALFTVDSPTTIRATVPTAATTGPVAVATVRGVATSANVFTIVQNPVLISQLYGAGGNSGATYNADYVELYNRGDTTVTLSGWSVQYASASGTSWQTVALTGSLAPGKYYLVKLAGGSTGSALPTADATGSINMSGTQGKVALRNSTSAFTGSSPAGQSGLQDLVGFGSANAYEGSAAPSPSATTALFRAGGGATDTGDNGADFTAAAPNPRNTAAGQPVAPVISSSATASGVVGQAFSYQIAASNTPTAFAASGLPAGLAVNTSSGLVSGTPTAAGVSSVTISATNAAGTGSATLTITVATGGGGTPTGGYTVDFEDGTKAAYASGNVTLNGISWNMTEALIGGETNDFKNGTKSARLRGYSTSVITMLADKSGGVGTISLQHRRYGTDTQVEWIVETSADAGATWNEAGRFTAGASAATFSAVVENPAATRVRIRTAATGSTNRRVNIDDIVVTDATVVSSAPTFADWAEGLADPAPAADPDGDGVANLLEYFMGLDPEVSESVAPQVSVSAGMLRLDYRRSKTLADGVTGVVEWTTSLASPINWSDVGVADVLVSDEGDHELRRASVTLGAGEPTKFIRLRVTLPTP